MKPSLLILLFTLLFAIPAEARLYKWIDDDGVFHVVDDLHKVPPADRSKLGLDLDELEKKIRDPEKSIIKTAPSAPPTKAVQKKRPTDPSAELFGDKTLEWWVKTFSRIRREKSEIEQSINAKEEFVSVYEGGRRFGTTYNQESIDRYNRYLNELPVDKEKLVKKKDYIDKLQRRAKNAGVPRTVRED